MPEIRACGVAPLARTVNTVRRDVRCRPVYRAATIMAWYYEIGSVVHDIIRIFHAYHYDMFQDITTIIFKTSEIFI